MKLIHKEKKPIHYLSIIRAIAICMVIIWHTSPPRNLIYIFGYDITFLFHPGGYPAVWIFFALSGYLMGKLFYEKKYTVSFVGIIRFYIGRILRIVPLYLLIIFVTYFAFFQGVQLDTGTWVRLFTFTANNYTLLQGFNTNVWTISVLMQFYFLVPFFYMLSRTLQKHRFPLLLQAITVLICGLFYRYYVFSYFAYNGIQEYVIYVYTSLLSNLDILVFSFIVAGIRENPVRIIFRLLSKRIALVIGIALYIVTSYYSCFFADRFEQYILFFSCHLPVFSTIFLSYIFLSFDMKEAAPPSEEKHNILWQSLGKMFVFVGSVSYGLYLWHWVVMDFFQTHFLEGDYIYTGIRKTSITFFVSFVLAAVSYILIEKPVHSIKKMLRSG